MLLSPVDDALNRCVRELEGDMEPKQLAELRLIVKESVELEKGGKHAEAYNQFLAAVSLIRGSTESNISSPRMSHTTFDSLVIARLHRLRRTYEAGASADKSTWDTPLSPSPVKKVLRFGESLEVFHYDLSSSTSTSTKTHSFVSHRVTDGFQLTPLYSQCLRVVLNDTKEAQLVALPFLRTFFAVSDRAHDELVQSVSAEPHFRSASIFSWQLNHLNYHACYSQSSFSGNLFSSWKRAEKHRLKSLLSELGCTRETQVVINEDGFGGATSLGFPLFKQLFTSLHSYDSNKALSSADRASVRNFIWAMQISVMEDASQSPLYIEENPENLAALEDLTLLSEQSLTLLRQYRERYAISALYQSITHLEILIPKFRPQLSQIIVMYVTFQKAFDQISAKGAVFNAVEGRRFKIAVKLLWVDVVSNYLSNIVRYFSASNLPSLVAMIKLLLLLAKVRDWLARSSQAPSFVYKEKLRALIYASLQNHYREILYQVERVRSPPSGYLSLSFFEDPDRLVPPKPSFLGNLKSLSPLQLVNVIEETWSSLPKLTVFDEVLSGARLDLQTAARTEYYELITSDVKYFTRKHLKEYRSSAILLLAMRYRALTIEMGGDLNIVRDLVGNLTSTWMSDVLKLLTESCLKVVNEDDWDPIDHTRRYSLSSWYVCNELMRNLDLAEGLKQLEDNDEKLKLEETYLGMYSRVLGVVLRLYFEHIYNLFVQEFPPEQHAQLHEIYLSEAFRFTHSGNAKMVARLTKKSSSRFSRGKSKKMKEREKELSEPTTLDEIMTETESWNIKIWPPKVVLSSKKARRYRKARNQTTISPSMCVKVNNMSHIRTKLFLWKSRQPELSSLFDRLLDIEKRIWNSFIGMLIYSLDFYITAQLEFILGKTKKKVLPRNLTELDILLQYLRQQLFVVGAYFNEPDLRSRFCARLWLTIMKSIDSLTSREEKMVLSIPQCAIVKTFLNESFQILSKTAVIDSKLRDQILDIMQLVLRDVSQDEFELYFNGTFSDLRRTTVSLRETRMKSRLTPMGDVTPSGSRSSTPHTSAKGRSGLTDSEGRESSDALPPQFSLPPSMAFSPIAVNSPRPEARLHLHLSSSAGEELPESEAPVKIESGEAVSSTIDSDSIGGPTQLTQAIRNIDGALGSQGRKRRGTMRISRDTSSSMSSSIGNPIVARRKERGSRRSNTTNSSSSSLSQTTPTTDSASADNTPERRRSTKPRPRRSSSYADGALKKKNSAPRATTAHPVIKPSKSSRRVSTSGLRGRSRSQHFKTDGMKTSSAPPETETAIDAVASTSSSAATGRGAFPVIRVSRRSSKKRFDTIIKSSDDDK
eukprot:TRINITY_DN746_c1_g3_i1.p1 TRINITY_DN746_c1_g3~~TRINITY_DN746_c1_g3_i1.p1  ORF type:complete len:1328 (-),score=241.42 TRINITY_DN746_c1_g3_i1:125-4108(-)